MATIEVRDVQGEVLEERELPAELFEAPVNVPVMHQVVVAGLAAVRAGTHSTKTRAEVRGGGRKPWRQKGTGRARHGSIRSPIWSGGGVSHGPKPRGYEMRINKKVRRLALRSALTDALQSGKLAAVSGLAFDGPRTKDAVGVLDRLGLGGRVLLVLAAPDEDTERSFRNLPEVKVDYVGNLSTYDLLYADRVLFTTDALDTLAGVEREGAREAEPAVGSQPEMEAKPKPTSPRKTSPKARLDEPPSQTEPAPESGEPSPDEPVMEPDAPETGEEEGPAGEAAEEVEP
jgi:large subunit ribosomal protein L4